MAARPNGPSPAALNFGQDFGWPPAHGSAGGASNVAAAMRAAVIALLLLGVLALIVLF